MAGIRIENVRKYYGSIKVVKDFSLDVADGEFVVLVGPSGCGKSTMLKILAGLEPASAGRVLIGGSDVTDLAPGDRDIAMVFQNYALYPHLTVRKNIGFGLKMRGMAAAEIEQPRPAGRKNPRRRPSSRPPPEGALGRPAAKGGARARHRPRAAGLPDGRTVVQPRREAARPHASRNQRASQALGVTTIYVTHDQIEAMTMADRS